MDGHGARVRGAPLRSTTFIADGSRRRVLERRIATYPAGEVMSNLLAVTGRRTALQKRLAELEAADQSSGDVQAQLVDVRDKLQGIEERLKDWEVEVSCAFQAAEVHPSLTPLHRRTRCDGTTTSGWSTHSSSSRPSRIPSSRRSRRRSRR